MKRLIIFFCLLIIVCFCFAFKKQDSFLTGFSGEYICFCKSIDESVYDKFNVVYNGIYYECTSNINQKKQLDEMVVEKTGETFVISKSEVNVDSLLENMNFSLLCEERLEDGRTVKTGLVPFYNQSIFLNGKKANAQIVETDNVFLIGFPLLLGSF